MLEALLKLSGPVVLSFALFLREEGVSVLKGPVRIGGAALAALGLFALHLAVLLTLGKAWFCGQCHYREETVVFLLPGAGYSLVIFASFFSEMLFSKDSEALGRIKTATLGWFFMAVGLMGMLLIGD